MQCDACVRLPVQWHIIIHYPIVHPQGPHSKTACMAWKTAWKKVFKVSSLSSPFSSLCSWPRSWLTHVSHVHFRSIWVQNPKGRNKKGDPWWRFLLLSSYIIIYLHNPNSEFEHTSGSQTVATWYKLSQCVALIIKQHRRNHSILVREELLQSSFFLSSCFMATMWMVFLVTSCRLLKTIQLLDIQCIHVYNVIGVQFQHLDLKLCQFFHGAILVQAGGSVAVKCSHRDIKPGHVKDFRAPEP